MAVQMICNHQVIGSNPIFAFGFCCGSNPKSLYPPGRDMNRNSVLMSAQPCQYTHGVGIDCRRVLGDTYDGAAHIVQTENHIGDGTTGYQYPMLPTKPDARVWLMV